MSEPRSARRRILKRALGLAGGTLLVAACAGEALAQKSSKSALLYQDHPHDGRRCSDCRYFTATPEAQAGSCALIEGAVERNGWCMAFSPRS
jgi:hypothetical protein